LSARRAVQVLKELAPLNVRAAKLFAKHITIEDQVKQLQESPFGIAVGTPHRILTLAQQGSLSLEETQCVVLDTFVNDKKFSVYTLPDTMLHTQDFLKEYIKPACQKRKDCRIGIV
jgi:protein CMS1